MHCSERNEEESKYKEMCRCSDFRTKFFNKQWPCIHFFNKKKTWTCTPAGVGVCWPQRRRQSTGSALASQNQMSRQKVWLDWYSIHITHTKRLIVFLKTVSFVFRCRALARPAIPVTMTPLPSCWPDTTMLSIWLELVRRLETRRSRRLRR